MLLGLNAFRLLPATPPSMITFTNSTRNGMIDSTTSTSWARTETCTPNVLARYISTATMSAQTHQSIEMSMWLLKKARAQRPPINAIPGPAREIAAMW
jgi:hypothetical protein